MKITVIRHEKVDYHWKILYRPQGVVCAFRAYDESPVIPRTADTISTNAPIYISELRRTYETAVKIFGKKQFIRSPLFNEVPIRPFTDMDIFIPTVVWDGIGRLQWKFKNSRQPEKRPETWSRANRAVDFLEAANEDCYVISHAFYMRSLIHVLKQRGYHGKFGMLWIHNLQRFVFSKDLSPYNS